MNFILLPSYLLNSSRGREFYSTSICNSWEGHNFYIGRYLIGLAGFFLGSFITFHHHMRFELAYDFRGPLIVEYNNFVNKIQMFKRRFAGLLSVYRPLRPLQESRGSIG